MNRPFAGFDLHTTPFIIHCGMMDARDVGLMVRGIEASLLAGDARTLEEFPFVGRIYRPRAKRAGVSPTVRRFVFARDGRRCRLCGCTERLEIDHIIPVVWGGTDEPENLQVLCKPCNLAKGPPAHACPPTE